MERFASFELAHEAEMADGRGNFHDNAHDDERCADAEREAGMGRLGDVLLHLELAQKQPEARDDEAEAHERDTSAQPGEISALGGEKVCGIGGLRDRENPCLWNGAALDGMQAKGLTLLRVLGKMRPEQAQKMKV